MTPWCKARQRLIAVGLPEDSIKSTVLAQNYPVAASICAWSEKKSADAIVMSSRGRGRLESFFMGATTPKRLSTPAGLCPVWVINGNVTDRGILIGVDHSPEALRAVDHAGLMLACGNQPITLFYSRRCLTCFVPRQVADAAPRPGADLAGSGRAPDRADHGKGSPDAGGCRCGPGPHWCARGRRKSKCGRRPSQDRTQQPLRHHHRGPARLFQQQRFPYGQRVPRCPGKQRASGRLDCPLKPLPVCQSQAVSHRKGGSSGRRAHSGVLKLRCGLHLTASDGEKNLHRG